MEDQHKGMIMEVKRGRFEPAGDQTAQGKVASWGEFRGVKRWAKGTTEFLRHLQPIDTVGSFLKHNLCWWAWPGSSLP